MPAPPVATRPSARWPDGARSPAGASTRGSPGARGTGILELQRTAGNRAVSQAIAAVQREDKDKQQTGTAQPDVVSGADRAAPRRTTGFLGLNPGTEKEADKLRRTSGDDVLTSLNDPVAEARFQNDPAVADFVFDELGISVGDFNRWDKASEVLLQANTNLREQLAEVMRWFNKAETGQIILDRLVLSGHSNGVELWGESEAGAASKPGKMLIERDLSGIAAVFPTAAGQVEDIMFSACFSINAVEIVKKVFPNLKNAWSYTAFSPSIKQGSAEHVAAFTRATEGQANLKRSNKLGTSALWTREKGYVVGDPSLAAAGPLYSAALTKWREIAEPMYMGTGKDLTSDQLMPAYMAAQQLHAHPGTPADRKKRAEAVMQLILRLRFWSLVRTRFGEEHKAKIQPIYEALGMSQPDWSKVTRIQVKEHVDAVKKALEEKPDAKGQKALVDKFLENGIYLMKDEEVIKTEWI